MECSGPIGYISESSTSRITQIACYISKSQGLPITECWMWQVSNIKDEINEEFLRGNSVSFINCFAWLADWSSDQICKDCLGSRLESQRRPCISHKIKLSTVG